MELLRAVYFRKELLLLGVIITFVYFLWLYTLSPYLRLLAIKRKYKNRVEIFFFPFLGFFYFYIPKRGQKDIGHDMLKKYIQSNPEVEFLASNIGNSIYFFFNKPDLVKEFAVTKHTLYSKWVPFLFDDIIIK